MIRKTIANVKLSKTNLENFIFLFIIILLSLIPISNFSLWADEAWSVVEYGLAPDFKNLIMAIKNSHGGDAQFPGYNIYLWCWIKIFGATEFSVRAANLPLFYLSLTITYFFLPRSKDFRKYFILLICLSPIIWYYLNESRYIISVFSFSLITLVSTISYFEGEEKYKKISLNLLLISLVAGTFFMMLYIFIFIPLLFIFIYYFKHHRIKATEFILRWKYQISLAVLFLLIIGFYYLTTLLNGVGGTRLTPSVKNILFVIYEFLGFGGIGPPRNILRENNLVEINSVYFYQILSFTLVYSCIFIFTLKKNNFEKLDRSIVNILLGLITCTIVFYFFAKLYQFKFLSRHIIFLYPLFIFPLFTLLYKAFLIKWKTANVIVIVLLLSGLIYSNINIRFNENYRKTDMFKVFQIAMQSNEKNIMWIEDRHGFEYYSKYRHLHQQKLDKQVIFISTQPENDIVNKMKFYNINEPFLVVIINKKDYQHNVRTFLISNSYYTYLYDKDYTIYRKR